MGYTLDINTTGGGTLDLGGATRSITAGGSVLFHGPGGYTISSGTFAANSSSGELLFHHYATGVVTLSATWGTGNNTLVKAGPGTLVISNKAGAGSLRIYDGALRAEHVSVLTNYWTGQIKNIILNGGVLELGAAGDASNTVGSSSGNIQFLGDGGFSAYGATRAVQLNSGTASIAWGSANFIPANSALLLSGKDANALIDFQNGLGLGSQLRVVRVADGSADVDARLSGVLSGGAAGGLIKTGAGTLDITGNNTYAGETWVKAGALLVNNASGEGTGSGAVTVFSGATIGGTGTVNRLTLKSGGKMVVYNVGGGIASKLKVTGALDITSGTLDLSGAGTLVPGQVIAQCGSLVGTQFDSVIGLSSGRTLRYTATSITVAPGGTVIYIR